MISTQKPKLIDAMEGEAENIKFHHEVYLLVKDWKEGKITRLHVQAWIDSNDDVKRAKDAVNLRLANIKRFKNERRRTIKNS